MYETIVFDVGNVVVKWEPHNVLRQLTNSEIEARSVLEKCSFNAWNLELDRGRSWDDAMRIAMAEHPDYFYVFKAYKNQIDQAHEHVFEGTENIIRELYDAGAAMYGLTNACTAAFRAAAANAPSLNLLSGVLVSGEVGLLKPDPNIFELLFDRYGINPLSALFVDDLEKNCLAAGALGMDAYLFKSPAELRSVLANAGNL